MRRALNTLSARLARWAAQERGAAAVELAWVVALITVPTLNVVDLAFYAYDTMQVNQAAQAGATAGASNCNTAADLPASTNCTTAHSQNGISFVTAVTKAIQSTTLGTLVSSVDDYPRDGYYCVNTSNALVSVASTTLTCSGVTNALEPNATPADYAIVKVKFSFSPKFPGFTVASLIPATITSTAYARLN
jgi:hypothetical protein